MDATMDLSDGYCNCCDEINSKPLKVGVTATATWKKKHPK